MPFKRYILKTNQLIADNFEKPLKGAFQNQYFEISLSDSKEEVCRSVVDKDGLAMLDITANIVSPYRLTIPKFSEKLILFIFCNSGNISLKENSANGEHFELTGDDYGVFSIQKSTDLEISLHVGGTTKINMIIACPKMIVQGGTENVEEGTHVLENYPFNSDVDDQDRVECLLQDSHNFTLEQLIGRTSNEKKAGYLDYLQRLSVMYGLFSEHLELCVNLESLHNEKDTEISYQLRGVIEKARISIHSDLTNYTTVKDLADSCNINILTLQRGFKGCYGHTVNQYVQNLRMEKAKEMLVNTHLHISEIVYNLGLVNRSYFTKLFKDHYDCTPTVFRKRYADMPYIID